MDDEISGHRNLLASFKGNDAARLPFPSSKTLRASKTAATCSKLAFKKREGLS
jgi:hypothetical protein